MHRWAPRGGLGILFLLAYPLLTHAAVTTGLAYLAWTAWLCIAALAVLSFPGSWGLAGFALLAAAPLAGGTEVPPDLARYTRYSTVVWTAFFVIMAAVAAALAALARPEIWSLFANGIDYLLVGVLFVGEYVFRRVRYRHHEHRPLIDVVRTVARAGRLAPRRTARK